MGLTFAGMSPYFKSISVVFLTGLLLVRTLVVPLILMDFQLRQDYIAKYVCENRNRPELHCDGKCYLAKKLKATQEHQEREAGSRLVQQLLELPASIASLDIRFEPAVFAELRSDLPPYQLPTYYSFLSARFRPPQA